MIVERIEELCAEKKITVSALEKTLGFGNSTIARWRTSSPSVCNLKAVADYFGTTVDYFLK